MSNYTYTLRTVTHNILIDGNIVGANVSEFLCESRAWDASFALLGESAHRRASALKTQVRRCRARWADKGPVYFIVGAPEVGYQLYYADDASAVAVWSDGESLTTKPGVKFVGLLEEKVKIGRRSVWTIRRKSWE